LPASLQEVPQVRKMGRFGGKLPTLNLELLGAMGYHYESVIMHKKFSLFDLQRQTLGT
jgi:hypothetical protein